MPEIERFEILVIGSGEAGKHLTWTMAQAGHRTAAGGRPFWVGRVGVWRFLSSMTKGLIRIDLVHQKRGHNQEPPTPRRPRGMGHS
jgi:hypothetical protein